MLINSIIVYRQRYYYKGIRYSRADIKSLLNKISKNRRIILCPESILIKKYNYSSKSVDKFIDNKIYEDFENKDNLLFHYEVDKEYKNVYLYSIRNNIRELCETAKDLRIEVLEFKIKDFVKSKMKNIKDIIILYKFNNVSYLLKISNSIIVDIITTIDTNDIKNYLSQVNNEKIVLVKDKEYIDVDNISVNYSIDLGVDTYENICKE